MPSLHQRRGFRGEALAQEYLEKKGYRFMKKNWACRYGEIDLIMKDAGELVFVEVKLRKNNDFGFPEEMVTRHKQNKLLRTALEYQRQHESDDVFWRFDIVAITLQEGPPEVIHFCDAIRRD